MRVPIFLIVLLLMSAVAQSAQVTSLRSMQDSSKQVDFRSLLASAGVSAKLTRPKSSDSGTDRYETFYKGVPIWNHTIAVRVNEQGEIDRIHGYLVGGIEKDVKTTSASFAESEAVKIAKKYHESLDRLKRKWTYSDLLSGLYIFVDDSHKAHLSYVVTFLTDVLEVGSPMRPYIFIDANTKKILRYSNQLTFAKAEATGPGGNAKIGKYYYGKDLPALDVTTNGSGDCVLDNGEVMTVDLNHAGNVSSPTAPIADNNAFTFKCSENTYKEINGAYSPLNDAHFNGVTVLRMYQAWFGHSPLNIKLKLRVHFGHEYENAFWDGKAMTFGDGKDHIYPTSTAVDVAGHEISHGFTQFNSSLEYRSESGGINEAFSDIAGEATEFFLMGKNDFLVGRSLMKTGDALRYMDDPTKDKKSIDKVSNYKWPSTCDFLMLLAGTPSGKELYLSTCTDAHYSSGLYNKAFYLMATANGSDTRKAFEVFVKANKDYWTEKTTFVDGAKGVYDAAKDVGFPQQVVKAAFAAVGINI